MASDDRKNVSFRLPLETIDQIEEIRKFIEDNTNKRVPIGIEISKTKALEVIISGYYEDVKEQREKEIEEKEREEKSEELTNRVVKREEDEDKTLD